MEKTNYKEYFIKGKMYLIFLVFGFALGELVKYLTPLIPNKFLAIAFWLVFAVGIFLGIYWQKIVNFVYKKVKKSEDG